jgi:hypothetical protein
MVRLGEISGLDLLHRLSRNPSYSAAVQLVQFERMENRMSYSVRFPWIYSFGNEYAGNFTDRFARIPLRLEPFMKFPG